RERERERDMEPWLTLQRFEGWMVGGWTDGGQRDGPTEQLLQSLLLPTVGWMDGWMDRTMVLILLPTVGWMERWMDGWMDGWMDRTEPWFSYYYLQ
ncbi:unnamed protein product, partial [Oncorhynchus mykiss]